MENRVCSIFQVCFSDGSPTDSSHPCRIHDHSHKGEGGHAELAAQFHRQTSGRSLPLVERPAELRSLCRQDSALPVFQTCLALLETTARPWCRAFGATDG